MLKRFTHLATSAALLLSISCFTLAGENDFKEQIIINSQDQNLDGVNKTIRLSRDVVIQQGSLLIKADDVEIVKGKDNEQTFEVIIARGNPATYQQQLNNGETIYASANEARYIVAGRILTLVGNAKLERTNLTTTSNKITFDMDNEQVRAVDKQGAQTVISPESFTKSNSKPNGADK